MKNDKNSPNFNALYTKLSYHIIEHLDHTDNVILDTKACYKPLSSMKWNVLLHLFIIISNHLTGYFPSEN